MLRFVTRRSVLIMGAVVLTAVAGWAGTRSRHTPSPQVLATGRDLFEHEWKPNDLLAKSGDGLGPVFNGRSCVECHFVGGVGGAGLNRNNVASFELRHAPVGTTASGRKAGVIHAQANAPWALESVAMVHAVFPAQVKVGGRPVVGNATTPTSGIATPNDLRPVIVHSINTPALFGNGVMDRINDQDILSLQRGRRYAGMLREVQGDFAGVPVGRAQVLANGRIGKFGWKGQSSSLNEFVATACAVELGLSNSVRKQDLPQKFTHDTSAADDMSAEQITALASFVAALPTPEQRLPESESDRKAVAHGSQLFRSTGCAECHTPTVGSAEGVYSDFLLYQVEDPPPGNGGGGGGSYGGGPVEPEPTPSSDPLPEEWKTPPLWGVADTAPYMHDGRALTLSAAIEAHGGQARDVRERFRNLSADDKQAVFAFLNTLRLPKDARQPAAPPAPAGQTLAFKR